MHDELGDTMKEIERTWNLRIPSRSFMVIRLDGRNFSGYTRRLNRPFDVRFAADMVAVTESLVNEIPGTIVAYTQSDEISVVASDLRRATSQHWFGGSVQKIVSSSAAWATAEFNGRRHDLGARPGTFDARVFPLSSAADVADYLWWRQADARRNAMSMLCHEHLGKKAVHNVPTRERLDLLAAAGISLDDVDPGFVNGRLVQSRTVRGPVTFRHSRTGEVGTVPDAERSEWFSHPAPLLLDRSLTIELIAKHLER